MSRALKLKVLLMFSMIAFLTQTGLAQTTGTITVTGTSGSASRTTTLELVVK